MIITKIADKKFVGKGIIHAAVWKKGDVRTIYHLIYQAGKMAPSYMKRFSLVLLQEIGNMILLVMLRILKYIIFQ